MRGAPVRPVREPELVGVLGRRAPVARVPAVPGRRPDPLARRGARQGDERAHRRLDPASAAAGPLDPGRERRPRPQRPDERRLDRRHGWTSCSRLGVELRFDAAGEAIESTGGRVTGDRRGAGVQRPGRLLHRGGPGRGAARADRDGRPQAHSPALAGLGRAPGPLDERPDVLSAPRRPARPRPQHLHRLRLGAHVDLPAAVLAALRPACDGRRRRRRAAVGRHLRLGGARRVHRAGEDRPPSAARKRSPPRSGTS